MKRIAKALGWVASHGDAGDHVGMPSIIQDIATPMPFKNISILTGRNFFRRYVGSQLSNQSAHRAFKEA